MALTVLQLRLEALAGHLDMARNPFGWFNMLELKSWRPDEYPWRSAVEMLQSEAQRARWSLNAEIIGLEDGTRSEQEAWRTYAEVKQKSDAIFREFMDLLGGLALRDRLKEEYVCRFADELIKDCAADVGRVSLFSIPAYEDPLSSTLRRAARVRFPDWHLWTLPMVAYEYGHVALRDVYFEQLVKELTIDQSGSDIDQIVDRARQEVAELAVTTPTTDWVQANLRGIAHDRSDAPKVLETAADFLRRGGEPDVAEFLEKAAATAADYLSFGEARAMVLLSDAFATFTTGPAYACASLFFRLDPCAPESPGRPADAERAELILAMLTEMNSDEVARPAMEFTDVLDDLRTYWNAVATAGGIDPAGVNPTLDAVRIRTGLQQAFARPKAEYSKRDWYHAHQQSSTWMQALAGADSLKGPEEVSGFRLRDALNIAWHCRLRALADLARNEQHDAKEAIEKAARQMCDSIIGPPVLGDPGPSFGGPAQRPTG